MRTRLFQVLLLIIYIINVFKVICLTFFFFFTKFINFNLFAFSFLQDRWRKFTRRRIHGSKPEMSGKQNRCPEQGNSKGSLDSSPSRCFPDFIAIDPTLPFHYRVTYILFLQFIKKIFFGKFGLKNEKPFTLWLLKKKKKIFFPPPVKTSPEYSEKLEIINRNQKQIFLPPPPTLPLCKCSPLG